jgi:hypothetical protein
MNFEQTYEIKKGTLIKVARQEVYLTRTLIANEGEDVLFLSDTIAPFYPKERWHLVEFIGMFKGIISRMSMYRHEFKIFEEF